MRNRFNERLETLHKQLIALGGLCETAIEKAMVAFKTGDKELAMEVDSLERTIDAEEREIESLCLKLLLMEQPVAGDFRSVSSALKMITDMERIGDQAADIAQILTDDGVVLTENYSELMDMTEAVKSMLKDAIDSFVNNDIELAKGIKARDKVVNAHFYSIKANVIKQISQDKSTGLVEIDILMVAKYLERIGDHATNIAEWVEFSILGVHNA